MGFFRDGVLGGVPRAEWAARIPILFKERVGRGVRSALPKKNRSLIQSALCS